ncbi:MAG: PEP/pyruvate-binding domain-containing protein, partial [Flavipsychrobacter sp.]
MSKNPFVLSFREVDKTKLRLVGGKGANLGELIEIEDIHVPEGFCITTEAYKRIIESTTEISQLLDQLSLLNAADQNAIGILSNEIRSEIERVNIPEDIKEAICQYISRLGEADAYAVRSSATAEDLPNASFAGQQDTYLNIIGIEAILKHVSKCWASLFTERAIIYRIQNGFDHRKVQLAVIIQRMVLPEVSGILFTADPITGNRKALSIDASYGLGEALVSGLVNPDVYKVYKGKISDKKIASKKLAIYGLKNGGTRKQEIETGQQNRQALTDRQILELEHIGRKIEAHFGQPQDIEWCLANNIFYIVQSRPITTLFPIPERQDEENHVYLSVGHQQMMTDPLRPLGLSLFQLTAAGKMYSAGGRLFVDVTQQLASPASRATLLKNMGEHDPLMKSAITTIIEREDFIKPIIDEKSTQANTSTAPAKPSIEIENNPEIVSELIKASE